MLLAWLAFAFVAASASGAFATAEFVVETFLVAEGTLGNDSERLGEVVGEVALA